MTISSKWGRCSCILRSKRNYRRCSGCGWWWKWAVWSGNRRFSSSDSSFINRSGRPVAFFLHASEIWVKALICWEKSKLLLWQYVIESIIWQASILYLRTDQKSMTFMLDQNNKGRIKMTKFCACELSYHVNNFDIVYKKGCHNIPPDGLSQISCALTE